jgi:YHS domain-containing protein
LREIDKMVRDLVCGMDVDETSSTLKVEYRGQTYFFCAQSCKERFEGSPEEFI